MFNRKPKLDSKIRFQQSGFKKQLNSARGYRRPIRSVPTTVWEIFLHKIGLGGFWARLLAGIVALGVLYLVYVPNILYVKNIVVVGTNPQQSEEVQAAVRTFFLHNPIKAQSNLLLLSKGMLAKFLIKQKPFVLEVKAIRKKLPNTLQIELEPRVAEFLLESKDKRYILSADGYFQQELAVAATSTPAEYIHLTRVKVTKVPDFDLHERVLNDRLIRAILATKSVTENKLRVLVDYFEFDSLESGDMNEHLQSGFTIYLDTTKDIYKISEQIKLILDNTEDAQKKNLYYIDMRFEDKGFVCFKNTPCVEQFLPKPAAATSTQATNPQPHEQ